MKQLSLLTTLCLALLNTAFAQVPAEEFKQVKKDFPKKDFVYTQYDWQIDIVSKKGEVTTRLTTEESLMCLESNGARAREGSSSSSYYSELEDLKVVAMIPEEKKYRDVAVTEFSEYSIGAGSVFHDDRKIIKYNWPRIEQGTKQYERMVFKYFDPHITPSFYVPAYYPVVKGKFTLNVQDGIDVEITAMHFDTLNAVYTETRKGKTTTMTWEFEQYQAFKYEDDMGNSNRFAPHILVRIKSYESPDGVVNVLRSIDDLHTWYCSFLKREDENRESLVPLVDSITRDCSNEMEAARAIYYWVQKNIEYVAIEDGINGFQPEVASKVCDSRFGDCKGMSNLLHQMYQIHGITSHLTWIGTRDLVYTYDEVPSPATDNHMILTVDIEGERYFLDPTNSLLAFGVPSPMTQGKQALISYDCDSFELNFVPIMEPQYNMLVDSTEVVIEGTHLRGKGKAKMTGYSRMFFMSGIVNSDYDYLKRYARSYLSKGSNKFVIDTIWLENSEDKDLPLYVHYTFRIDDHVMVNDREKYLNFNLDVGFEPDLVEKDRTAPMQLYFRTIVDAHSVLKLSDGDQVIDLPEDHAHNYEYFGYDVNYRRDGNAIYRNSREQFNFIDLTSDHFATWNEYRNNVVRSVRESLIINANE